MNICYTFFEDYECGIAKYGDIKTLCIGETNPTKFLDICLSKLDLGVEKNHTKANSNVISYLLVTTNPAGIYLLKVNNRNTRTRCEICSKLTIKTPERRH